MKHQLPPLPYSLEALAPIISKETLEYHYGKHHKAYVNKLNELIPNTTFETLSLENIIKKAPKGPIFNNAAQTWNHTFYWHCMTPLAAKNKLKGALEESICKSFGSFSQFKEAFTNAAIAQFGSGWAWLIKDAHGLKIETTSNALTPLSEDKICLLTCDVWEHAYYIDYRNARPHYLEKFWDIVNWDFVTENFEKQ
ncbi:superoxide dismutase [Rickettsiella grylli]|uniref:superoxide dismutase n=1 Tax=Rickettsiella grylli TaxID=59196 RepID=UPI0008FCF010|nr:superoxide dismutase [Rickettsiella grylli]OJA00326.1 superoxide dismutase [Rickettsiella grylli]